jgi:hypothetical protein
MMRFGRVFIVGAVVLLAFTAGFSGDKKKDSKAPSAPLPKPIVTAKTAFLVKGPGSDPYLKGGGDLAFDTFYADMKAWGKYQIVDTPDQADIVFELSYSSRQVGTSVWSSTNTYTGATQVYSSPDMDPRVSLNVYDRKTGFVLWSAAEARDTARRRKNREKNLIKAVHDMVSNLRMRTENTESE